MKNYEFGSLVISLDFELAWGVHDTRSLQQYGTNILGVRQALPKMLDLFDKYQVKATFATVGMLFAESKEHLISHLPEKMPTYENLIHSPFRPEYFKNVGENESRDLYHFAPSLIKLILDAQIHEIGSHTFSHFYCLEKGNDLVQFNADLIAAKAIASEWKIALKSMVFPRNQYSLKHLIKLKENGFTHYRGTEMSPIYAPLSRENEKLWRRAGRILDSYLNLTGTHTYTHEEIEKVSIIRKKNPQENLLNIPSSRFLRPFSQKLSFLSSLQIHRIHSAMEDAAKRKAVFHLWWHPHNFGSNLSENLILLEKILEKYQFLNEKYGFESKTMCEF